MEVVIFLLENRGKPRAEGRKPMSDEPDAIGPAEPAEPTGEPPGAADDEAPINRGGKQRVERLWDDEGFRRRVTEVAQLRRKSIREVVIGAGTSSDYLQKIHGF